MPASAEQQRPEGGGNPTALRGRDVLVAGAGAVADARAPAVVTIDVGQQPPSQARLALLLSPVSAAPDENYLILISMKTPAGDKRVGTVSFYPPRPDRTQTFYLNAAPILAEARERGQSRIDLSITLVGAENQTLTRSAVRIDGARFIET